LLSNRDGAVVQDGREVLDRIVDQVANPVRWDLCMQSMVDLGVTALIEVPPAGTLAGLAKRGLPGIEIVAVKTPDDLDKARDLIARHGGGTNEMNDSPTWRMLVAPSKGIFRRADAGAVERSTLAPGASIGVVSTSRDETPVIAKQGGIVVEWLAEDGDPVSPGQPLVRLHPVGALV
jgi:[acyl-carrier-protein] S-malonyltransferase